jgi:hypothetical protein
MHLLAITGCTSWQSRMEKFGMKRMTVARDLARTPCWPFMKLRYTIALSLVGWLALAPGLALANDSPEPFETH